MDLLGAVAAILPGSSTVAELGGVAPPVRLSRRPATLGCAHPYARFTAHFHGRREVAVPSVPGFGRDEPLPLSFDAVVDVLVEGARSAADDAPFVLLDTYLPDGGFTPPGTPSTLCGGARQPLHAPEGVGDGGGGGAAGRTAGRRQWGRHMTSGHALQRRTRPSSWK
ncbi:hypothetical protein ACFXOY_13910 [Streptomyces niveus]|uniref:hypothetical protein n=1 Tax=Streptomyces niveus TaxID=193462 RepID=UPI0036C33F04